MSKNIAFWPHVRDIATASFRLRCHQILEGLSAKGVECGLYNKSAPPPHTLVLSKRYDEKTIRHAASMRARHGTRIVLDICDNHFYSNRNEPIAITRAELLRNAVRTVDLVVASSEELAKVIRTEAGQDLAITVIADTVEYPSTPDTFMKLRNVLAEFRLNALRSWLNQADRRQARKIIWFGNHGSGFADGGMADLLRVKDIIESTNKECPLTLTVISNSKEKFAKLIGD